MKNITMLGFGSWGITLAILLAEKGHKVTAWDSNNEYINEIHATRRNKYLPEAVVPPEIRINYNIHAAAQSADIFVLTLPSKNIPEMAKLFAPHCTADKIIVNASKGLVPQEQETLRISQYLQTLCPAQTAVLTGPSHAEEVLQKIPTTVLAASASPQTAETVQNAFSTDHFRVYKSTDIIGAEIGGALKNVIALAAGICDGLGFGDNTKAALITRGIAEITRLGTAMGGKPQTFSGLSGIGDLIVTCASKHSRNWQAGNLLAQGKTLTQTLSEVGSAVEGAQTAKTALQLARQHNITMPITEEINNVLYKNKCPKEAVTNLMLRELKEE